MSLEANLFLWNYFHIQTNHLLFHYMDITEIPPARLSKILNDPEKTAKAIDLIYVNDSEKGIIRKRKGKSFEYVLDDKVVSNEDTITRIKAMVIPPAWEDVWICSKKNGHLQVTGKDLKGRKQYKYHADWNNFRNQTKYHRLYTFGNVLPQIRLQVEKDLATHGLNKRKVLAAVVSLMERTHIRVGNTMYEKLYGSYGLTTLKDKHVAVKGATVKFQFIGKKGVKHEINLKNRKLSKIVQSCKDIPGRELFQFFDDKGDRHCIDSGMVNEYINETCEQPFTAKDFRTWAGSVEALLAFKEIGSHDSITDGKKKMVEALDIVSGLLGNTRTVCKKYYVHPIILSLYEEKTLKKYLNKLDNLEKNDNRSGLTSEEKVLMDILKKGG